MNSKIYQVSLDPEALSQVQQEFSFFNEIRETREVRDFWDSVVVIVRRIIRDDLTDGQKKVMMLFLNKAKFKGIAAILSKSHRTIYYRYHAIIRKVSHILSRDEEFLSISVPAQSSQIVDKWLGRQAIDGEYRRGSGNALVRVGEVMCPVCRRKFANDNSFKLHLVVAKYRNGNGSVMRNRHVKFILQQEEMLLRYAVKHSGPISTLIEAMMKMKTFYLGRGWIYKLFRSENFKKMLYSRRRSIREKAKKTVRSCRSEKMQCPKQKLQHSYRR